MEKIHWLAQIQSSEHTLVGDQALQLSQLQQRGYPVKPGFVVSSQVWREFLDRLLSSTEIADLFDSYLHLNVDNWHQLQQVAQRLRQAITQKTLGVDLSHVVATAANSWRTSTLIFYPDVILPEGTPQNQQNVLPAQVSTNTPEAIASTLLRTWSQLFSAGSLLYWRRLGIDVQQLDIAVLVQPLQNAIASGILNCQATKLEINASYGLGIAITRGEVIPDSYIVEHDGAVRSHLGHKTIAYGVANLSVPAGFTRPTPFAESQDEVQVYLLNLEQQQQYALKDQDLQQLIHLGRTLSATHSAMTFEWALELEGVNPQLLIAQCRYSPVAVAAKPPTPSQSLLRGLAAAPGRSIAPAYYHQSSAKTATIATRSHCCHNRDRT